MYRAVIFIGLFIIISTATFAQKLRISAVDEPLNSVLERFDVELSYNSTALSAYRVSVDKTFNSAKKAIDYLLRDKPFTCEQMGDVYVIAPMPQVVRKKSKIAVSNPTVTDLPTIEMEIGEVIITSPQIDYSPSMGVVSGKASIDHRLARFMPGSGDNSVFNLLRMMPGVRASGEPSDELIVWGSMAGESRITFNGITIFGMRGFNDNISFINPYMVRDVKLLKGGFGAEYGNNVGAIAMIDGVEPSFSKPTIKATLNTLTANIYGSIPVSKRAALSVAYRRTFYDLYESAILNPYNGRGGAFGNGKGQGKKNADKQQIEGVYIDPKYSFSDLNIGFAGTAFEKDNYKISLYGADDRFNFSATPIDEESLEASERSNHVGASVIYNRFWRNNTQTHLLLSYSGLREKQNHVFLSQSEEILHSVDNAVREITAKVWHDFSLGAHQKMEVGVEVDNYLTRLNGLSHTLTKPTVYATERVEFGSFLLDAGIRMDVIPSKIKIQPRVSASYALTKGMTATASWGMYNQYLSRIPEPIEMRNYTLVWGVNEALSSMNSVVGVSYAMPLGFFVSVEGYAKQTRHAIRIVDNNVVSSDVHIYGTDIFLSKKFSCATLFGSYSFTHIATPITEAGHEVKIGGMVTLSSFVIFANYVYGKGFNTHYFASLGNGNGNCNQGALGRGASVDVPYSRLDLSATYRVRVKNCQLQSGVSLINVLFAENIKYSYALQRDKDPVTLFSQAMPFTPMVFFEVIW